MRRPFLFDKINKYLYYIFVDNAKQEAKGMILVRKTIRTVEGEDVVIVPYEDFPEVGGCRFFRISNELILATPNDSNSHDFYLWRRGKEGVYKPLDAFFSYPLDDGVVLHEIRASRQVHDWGGPIGFSAELEAKAKELKRQRRSAIKEWRHPGGTKTEPYGDLGIYFVPAFPLVGKPPGLSH